MTGDEPMDWDAAFDELAKETARVNDKTAADPAYQRKRAAEDAKIEAGIGVYTPEELAEQEQDETDDDERTTDES